MRLLLVDPPSRPGVTVNREGAAGLGNRYPSEGAFLYPPHTLATVAAVLREAGHRPALLDATAEQLTIDASIQRLRESAPEGIGVLLSWAGWEDDLAFCRAARQAMPAVPLIAMGTILRQAARAAAAAQASDLALVGEPERAFAPAMERAMAGRAAGVANAEALAPAHYAAGGYLADIDGLPMPAWDLAPVARYRMLTVLSSRGCDLGCRYCPYVIGWGHTFRACSPRRVVDELQWLMERFRPARIMFRDPVFAHDRQRVVQICEDVLRRRLSVAWECESRPEHFDPELLRLMQRAGCATIKIGVESGDAARLVALGRISHADASAGYRARVSEVVQTCRQIELRCQVFVMAGWGDTDAAELEHTVAFVRELAPQHLSVKRIEAYPGTPWSEAHGEANEDAFEAMKGRLMPLAASPAVRSRPWWRRGVGWLGRRLSGRP